MAKNMKLTKEESVFAQQLFDVRQRIHQLEIEDATHSDRLLTIMRGHRVKTIEGFGFMITRAVVNSREIVVVTEHGKYPT